MPISGCHDLPLATFNSPVVNTRPTPEQPPRKKQHRHSGIFRVADLGPGTMPRGKYPESPAPAGSHALISRTPTPGGMLHANLGLPRPPPRNFQLSCGQHTPDTGATPKKKTTSSFRNFPRGWPPSWNDAVRKISGISRASGLPRPHFQNADPGRHAPCQSRAATTSPSQLSTSPPATAPSPTAKESPPPPRRLGGGFNPLRGATTGVVIRRRATSGEMARGGWLGGGVAARTGAGGRVGRRGFGKKRAPGLGRILALAPQPGRLRGGGDFLNP